MLEANGGQLQAVTMALPRRHYIDSSFGQIHTRIARPENPTLPPLLCLHMFPQSGRNFEPFAQAASAKRIVVAPDFPGHGESDPPPTQIEASDYAGSMWEVVDALNLTESHGKIDLFGIHAGAKLATEFARQRPDHVRKIILSSAAVLYKDEIEQLKKSFEPIPLDKEGRRFRRIWDMLIKNQGPGVTLDMLATHLSEILRGGETYEWGHHAVFNFNREFPKVVNSLTHEITLLNPKDDLYDMTPRTMEFLQNGKLLDMPHWGQSYLEVYPDEVAKTVDTVLA